MAHLHQLWSTHHRTPTTTLTTSTLAFVSQSLRHKVDGLEMLSSSPGCKSPGGSSHNKSPQICVRTTRHYTTLSCDLTSHMMCTNLESKA